MTLADRQPVRSLGWRWPRLRSSGSSAVSWTVRRQHGRCHRQLLRCTNRSLRTTAPLAEGGRVTNSSVTTTSLSRVSAIHERDGWSALSPPPGSSERHAEGPGPTCCPRGSGNDLLPSFIMITDEVNERSTDFSTNGLWVPGGTRPMDSFWGGAFLSAL